MLQRDDRCIVVDRLSLLLTVDEGLARGIAETNLDVTGLDVRQQGSIHVAHIDEFARGRQLRVVKGCRPRHVVVHLVLILQLHVVHIHHLVHLARLE